MFALGCIQAQTCHTGTCPTGVTTQDPWRQKALVVPDKIDRVARFHRNTLEALKELIQAAGLHHPRELRPTHIVRRGDDVEVRLLANHLQFLKPGSLMAAIHGQAEWPHPVYRYYWPISRADSFLPQEPTMAPELAMFGE
jgi:hypothetical protein